ncbi:ThuA domain-containing protein [Pedobacter sp. SYSU D00535]|uniref:ThuA domain-containing protein n=1 Tax=Pedobacter sp. SYSU D00535 TaxID=2810308 RepID=UPI001A96E1CA|nr:ThuA domain-containing protein [Pedobacter sp. SYSU D00535]
MRLPGIIAVVLAVGILAGFTFGKKPARVLVFFKTKGFYHKNIPAGITAIQRLGQENGFLVDTTTNSALFTTANLRNYHAVIFLNPTGDTILTESEKSAFKKYIQQGGGFVGIHAATDCLFHWEWYGKLVGGFFKNHPKVQTADLTVVDRTHPATRHLPAIWTHTDEWYNFRSLNPDVNVLLNLEESSYKGGENGPKHPIAWYHSFDGGRAFYTGLGHTVEDFSDEKFLKHLLGGIQYAAKIGRKD